MKWSQIRGRIEICMGKMCFRFEKKLLHFIFSCHFNTYPYFQPSTEILSYSSVETLGDLQSTSRGLDSEVRMWSSCGANFYAPGAHFDKLDLQWCSGRKMWKFEILLRLPYFILFLKVSSFQEYSYAPQTSIQLMFAFIHFTRAAI
jgi:hypothetical protein